MSAARKKSETAFVLGELFPEGDDASRVRRAFRAMEIAEEEIAAAKLATPRKRKSLHGAFRAMYSRELLLYPDAVYRAHVREILARVRLGADLSPGTDAEVLVAMSAVSLAGPPGAGFAAAMSKVFFSVFPDAKLEAAGAEYYSGQIEEIVGEFRRKLARDRERP